MPQPRLAGQVVHWLEQGEGHPVLALHCSLAHSGAWGGVIRQLGSAFRLIAPDLPGHGRTHFDQSRDIQAQAVASAAALALREGRAVHLMGHSFGATVALRLAVERPELVASLMLIEPVYFVLLDDAGHPAYADYVARGASFTEAYRSGDLNLATRRFVGLWGDGGPDTVPADQWAYMVDRIYTVEASQPSIIEPARRDRLHLEQIGPMPFPVLLMEGARSDPVISAIQDVLVGRMSGAQRVVVPDAGHMLPITHPAPVAQAFRALTGS